MRNAIVKNGEYILPAEIDNKIVRVTQEQLNSVRVEDDGTPMVRIDTQEALGGAIVFPYSNMWLRSDVAVMLGRAALILQKKYPNLLFCVNDAYRPMARQRQLFDSVRHELYKLHPDLSAADLYALVTNNVADPAGGLHTGGGAIDITLVDATGVELDMGFCPETVGIPDFDGDFPDERNALRSARLPEKVFLNRLIVAEVMTEAGFYGDNEEWWHFNGRNRTWAYLNHEVCPYGDIETEEDLAKNVGDYIGPNVKNDLPGELKLRVDYKA